MTAAIAYALELVTVAHVRDPRPNGGGAVVSTTSLSLATWEGDDLTLRACAVKTTPVLGTRTTYGPAFVSAAPVVHARASYQGDTVSIGPWDAPFGVGDDDDDGNPGVTVHVEHVLLGAGDIYLSQATRTLLVGTWSPSGELSGLATVEAEPSVLGASTWWLRLPIGLRAVPSASTFRLVPIGEATCAAVDGALASSTASGEIRPGSPAGREDGAVDRDRGRGR